MKNLVIGSQATIKIMKTLVIGSQVTIKKEIFFKKITECCQNSIFVSDGNGTISTLLNVYCKKCGGQINTFYPVVTHLDTESQTLVKNKEGIKENIKKFVQECENAFLFWDEKDSYIAKVVEELKNQKKKYKVFVVRFNNEQKPDNLEYL